MRPLAFAALLVSATLPCAAQQPVPPLTPDQEAALYGLPVLIVGGGAILIATTLDDAGTLPFLALPLVAAATACGAGHLTGAAGSCRGALVGAAQGALPGFALIALSAGLGGLDVLSAEDTVLALALLGVAAYILVPPFTAPAGYRRGARPAGSGQAVEAAPTALRLPNGEVAPGATLRLRF